MRRTRLPFWVALLALAPAARGQDEPRRPPPPRDQRAAKPLAPLVSESLEQALERAAARDQVALVAVGLAPEGEAPRLFQDAAVARASRLLVALAAVEHDPAAEFFRSRKLGRDVAPCVLVLDPRGNVIERHPETVAPDALLASGRSVKTQYLKIREELPGILARAEALAAAADEKGLLALARPWLARHARGFPELERLRALVVGPGKARLAAVPAGDPAEVLRALEALGREYADSPVEALACVRMASVHADRTGNRDAAKALLARVLDELPWPENAEAHEQARAMLGRFRQEEIRRRLEELEKKKKEEKK